MTELFAGLDLGGTRFKLAVADAAGGVLAEAEEATHSEQGSAAVIERMAALVRKTLGRPELVEHGSAAALLGVGVGCPGLLDAGRRLVRRLPNLAGHWEGVALADELEQRLDVPVHLLNDARLAALGEWTYGHGRSLDQDATMVMLTVGTGVGGGLVLGGRLHLGASGAAGELGHMVLDPDGPPCGCGGQGCVEVYAAGPAIVGEAARLLRSGHCTVLAESLERAEAQTHHPRLTALSAREVSMAAESGDRDAAQVLARAGRALGTGIANLVTVLEPELVVVGGGVAAAGEDYWRAMREAAARCVRLVPFSTDALVRSLLGSRAGMLGGVALAVHRGRL